MKGNGVDPKKVPTTARTPSWPAIQRILAGEQYMTVYKAIKPEAEQAAELAYALSRRASSRPASLTITKVNNGKKDVSVGDPRRRSR